MEYEEAIQNKGYKIGTAEIEKLISGSHNASIGNRPFSDKLRSYMRIHY